METLSYAKPVKAKKEHRCNYCIYLISKGEVYEKSTHKYYGEVYTWKSHLKCSNIASKLKMFDHADEGVTSENFHETIQYQYQDLMIKHHLELYESKDFKYPKFNEQLDFVIKFHNGN